MQVEYAFLLRTEVNLGSGDWAALSFDRSGFQVRIPKPILGTSLYLKIKPCGGPVGFDISRFKPGWGLALRATEISIQLESRFELSEDKIDHTFQAAALEILNHLKSWIRVLTRQYWVGYQECAFPQQDFNVNVIAGKDKKSLGARGVSAGYDYWKPIDQGVWTAVGEKLAKGSRPSVGQLFFCDALSDIGTGDLAQAVVALGVACELEVYSAAADVREKKEGAAGLKNLQRPKFKSNLDYLGSLNQNPFRRFDAGAARLVNLLYEMRGSAAHRGHLPFLDVSKSEVANAAQLIQYVGAAERLFDWLEIQRSELA